MEGIDVALEVKVVGEATTTLTQGASFGGLLDGAPRGSLVSVSKVGEKLLEDALKLGLPERAELVAELLASLDGAPDEDAEAAWAAEIKRRAARARSGNDPGRPWPKVRDRIRNGLSKP